MFRKNYPNKSDTSSYIQFQEAFASNYANAPYFMNHLAHRNIIN